MLAHLQFQNRCAYVEAQKMALQVYDDEMVMEKCLMGEALKYCCAMAEYFVYEDSKSKRLEVTLNKKE